MPQAIISKQSTSYFLLTLTSLSEIIRLSHSFLIFAGIRRQKLFNQQFRKFTACVCRKFLILIGVCESMESKKSELVSLLEDITEPSCPQSGEKFQFLGKSDGENRSLRFKWVCSKCVPVPKTGSRVCTCGTPCTDSTYGKCVYTYPDKTFRLYPCVAGNTEHWDRICKHRVPA